MAIQIVDRFSGDKGMQPLNQTPLRKFSVGANWTSLKCSLRLTTPQNAATNFGGTRLFMGLCNVAGGGYGKTSPAHLLGMLLTGLTSNPAVTSGTGYATLNYGLNADQSRALHVTSGSEAVNTAWNTSSSGARIVRIGCVHPSTAVAYVTYCFFLFTRSTGAIAVDFSRWSGTSSTNIGLSRETFVAYAEGSQTPTQIASAIGTNVDAHAPASSPFAIDESTHGVFDGFNYAWSGVTTQVELNDLIITKVS